MNRDEIALKILTQILPVAFDAEDRAEVETLAREYARIAYVLADRMIERSKI